MGKNNLHDSKILNMEGSEIMFTYKHIRGVSGNIP